QEALFLQSLVDEQIPFHTDDLKHALTWLADAKNKSRARLVLQGMMTKRLPMNKSVFNAMYALETTRLSEQMHELLQHLIKDTNRTPLKQQMIVQLSRLLYPSLSADAANRTAAKGNSRHVFHLLKTFGVVDAAVTFAAW